MKHLFVSDLDGTLLNRESRVTDRSAEILSRLARQNLLFTVATARTPATVEPLLAHTLTAAPAIVLTGAAMWNRKTQSYINPRFIDPDSTDIIISTCRCHGISPFSYTIDSTGIIHTFYCGRPTAEEQRFIDERSHLKLKRFHISRTATANDIERHPDTILIFALGPLGRIYSLADDLRATGLCSVSSYPDIFNPETAFIEIFAPGVSKAAAVSELKKMTGADSLTVFGDNLNDIPMMEVADVAVAVENALPEVKDAADVIIGNNESDAVARYISEKFTEHIQ